MFTSPFVYVTRAEAPKQRNACNAPFCFDVHLQNPVFVF